MDPLKPHVDAARAAFDTGYLSEYDKAAERGRRIAAEAVRTDPERRKLVESVYGVVYCRNRYPEAYRPSKDVV